MALHDTSFEGLDGEVDVIHLDHHQLGIEENLIQASSRSSLARTRLYQLAMQGFHLYRFEAGQSRFVRDSHIPNFWHRVRNGELACGPEGIVHTVEEAPSGSECDSLIVVFSSMAAPRHLASLQRYMMLNFQTLRKYAPQSAAILRVSDIDGVVGGFYMDTRRHPDRVSAVTQLVERIASERAVPSDRIVAYGPSKGGTGALYYALKNGWRCVAVDPSVDDEHYEKYFDDSSFTAGGIFVRRKVDLFRDVASNLSARAAAIDGAPWTVITSPRSPLFPYIRSLVDLLPADRVQFIQSLNSQIRNHPDVSRWTLPFASSSIVGHSAGIAQMPGVFDVDRAR